MKKYIYIFVYKVHIKIWHLSSKSDAKIRVKSSFVKPDNKQAIFFLNMCEMMCGVPNEMKCTNILEAKVNAM